MWVEVIGEFLKKEELRKSYAFKAKERTKDFNIEKIAQEWKKVMET